MGVELIRPWLIGSWAMVLAACGGPEGTAAEPALSPPLPAPPSSLRTGRDDVPDIAAPTAPEAVPTPPVSPSPRMPAMGLMPPYDPFEDPALAWALVRVVRCDPPSPTWGRPAALTLRVEATLRGALPNELVALFDAPREAAQARFYATRDASPEQAAVQLAELDARPIAVPPPGHTVIVWLAAPPTPSPPGPAPSGPVPPSPPGVPVVPAAPPGGFWTVPSPRRFGQGPIPFAERWIEAAHLDAVRARLGLRGDAE